MKLYGLKRKTVGYDGSFFTLVVDKKEDWVGVDIKKHLDFLLPKALRLMIKYNRPLDRVQEVLEVYGYYFCLQKMGLSTVPEFEEKEEITGQHSKPEVLL